MGDKARQYTPSTVKRLHTLSGNQCAAPDCGRPLIARDSHTIISKICHIEAASSDGPRYNPNMTDDERRHFNNLILLCDECHSIIDNKKNESEYPVLLLKKWKKDHEDLRINQLTKKSSLLKLAIDAISEVDFDEVASDDNSSNPYDIENKIKYNAIKRNKPLIEEYKVFYHRINSLYRELETYGSFKKKKLLRNIKQIYLRAKGEYIGDSENLVDELQKNSDNIIEYVENKLFEIIKDDKSKQYEDISFGISIIMVDAFMRCKILEEPPKS